MQAFGKREQASFKFPADDGVYAKGMKMVGIQRCIQAIGAKMSARIQLPEARDSMRRDSRRRMHRQMKGDQVGSPDDGFVLVESFLREIQLVDRCSVLPQPSRR